MSGRSLLLLPMAWVASSQEVADLGMTAPPTAEPTCYDHKTQDECQWSPLDCDWVQEIEDRGSSPACHPSGDDWCWVMKGKNSCKSMFKCQYISNEKKCVLMEDEGCGGLAKGECGLYSQCFWTTECVSIANNPCAPGYGKKRTCAEIPGCAYNNKVCSETDEDPRTMECGLFSDKGPCKANGRCKWQRDFCTGPSYKRKCGLNQLILQLPNYYLQVTGATGMVENELTGFDEEDVLCQCFEKCTLVESGSFWNLEMTSEYSGKCSCYTDIYEKLQVKRVKKATEDMSVGGVTLEYHAVLEAAAP